MHSNFSSVCMVFNFYQQYNPLRRKYITRIEMRFFAIPADFGTPERSESTPCGLTENGFGPFGNLNYRTNGINRTRIDVCLILRWLQDYKWFFFLKERDMNNIKSFPSKILSLIRPRIRSCHRQQRKTGCAPPSPRRQAHKETDDGHTRAWMVL